jgi:hypothetical protein
MEERIMVMIAPVDAADHLLGGTIGMLVAKTLDANPSLDSPLETFPAPQRPQRAIPGVMWSLTDRALQDELGTVLSSLLMSWPVAIVVIFFRERLQILNSM